MRVHHVLPEPMYKHYAGFPDILGRYAEFPEHREHRPKDQLPFGNLHLVLRGKGVVRDNGNSVELRPGSGFYYGPGLEQEYGSDPDDPWDVFWVHMAGDGIERLLNGRGSTSPWVFACRDPGRIGRLSFQLLELASSYDSNREVELAAKLYELLAELAHHAEPLGMPAALDKRASMRAAAEYIRVNCVKPLTLGAMAEQAGYSSYYFSRLFHEAIGRTPMQWLLESRIVVAKQLLISTGWTVKQVAEATCFTQSSYFIARFREQTGLTPQQYRQLFGQS